MTREEIANASMKDQRDYYKLRCEQQEAMLVNLEHLTTENARLREELQRYKDYEDMKQRWAEEALRESSTRSTPRPPIGNPPHGD